MRYPIYEHLYQLNRNLDETVEILERIGKSRGMRTKPFRHYRVEVECLRSEATQDVIDVMNDIESAEAADLSKRKRAYQKSIGDPDDIYFEVRDREEERRKQGLPSLIGVLRGHTREPGDIDLDDTAEETNSDVTLAAGKIRRKNKSKHHAQKTKR